MKKFYTSNYKRNGMNPFSVGISYVIPGSYHGATFGGLAPTLELLGNFKWDTDRLTEEEYEEKFLTLLGERDDTPQTIYERFPDGTIFLCYEDPGEFCHRRLVAKWLQENLGMEVPEWKSDKERKSEKHDKVVDNLIDF